MDVCKDRSSLSPWPVSARPCLWAASPLPSYTPDQGPRPPRGSKALPPLSPQGSSIPSHTHRPGCAPVPPASNSGSFLESALPKANTVTLRSASRAPSTLIKTASLPHRCPFQIPALIKRADPTHPTPPRTALPIPEAGAILEKYGKLCVATPPPLKYVGLPLCCSNPPHSATSTGSLREFMQPTPSRSRSARGEPRNHG